MKRQNAPVSPLKKALNKRLQKDSESRMGSSNKNKNKNKETVIVERYDLEGEDYQYTSPSPSTFNKEQISAIGRQWKYSGNLKRGYGYLKYRNDSNSPEKNVNEYTQRLSIYNRCMILLRNNLLTDYEKYELIQNETFGFDDNTVITTPGQKISDLTSSTTHEVIKPIFIRKGDDIIDLDFFLETRYLEMISKKMFPENEEARQMFISKIEKIRTTEKTLDAIKREDDSKKEEDLYRDTKVGIYFTCPVITEYLEPSEETVKDPITSQEITRIKEDLDYDSTRHSIYFERKEEQFNAEDLSEYNITDKDLYPIYLKSIEEYNEQNPMNQKDIPKEPEVGTFLIGIQWILERYGDYYRYIIYNDYFESERSSESRVLRSRLENIIFQIRTHLTKNENVGGLIVDKIIEDVILKEYMDDSFLNYLSTLNTIDEVRRTIDMIYPDSKTYKKFEQLDEPKNESHRVGEEEHKGKNVLYKYYVPGYAVISLERWKIFDRIDKKVYNYTKVYENIIRGYKYYAQTHPEINMSYSRKFKELTGGDETLMITYIERKNKLDPYIKNNEIYYLMTTFVNVVAEELKMNKIEFSESIGVYEADPEHMNRYSIFSTYHTLNSEGEYRNKADIEGRYQEILNIVYITFNPLSFIGGINQWIKYMIGQELRTPTKIIRNDEGVYKIDRADKVETTNGMVNGNGFDIINPTIEYF